MQHLMVAAETKNLLTQVIKQLEHINASEKKRTGTSKGEELG